MPKRLRTVPDDVEVTAYTIRDIPADLWKKARIRAMKDDLDMRSLLIGLLERYVKKGLN